MALYKGTSPIALNGANGADGANGANGYGIRCWQNYNETHNEYEGERGTGVNNTVIGAYSSCGGYNSVCDGSNGDFVFGYENELHALQGNSVYGYQNKLTHASEGCHTEGYTNWLKAAQGAHLEGYDNKAQGGLRGGHHLAQRLRLGVGALRGLELHGRESQNRSHDYDHERGVDDSICVAIGIHTAMQF